MSDIITFANLLHEHKHFDAPVVREFIEKHKHDEKLMAQIKVLEKIVAMRPKLESEVEGILIKTVEDEDDEIIEEELECAKCGAEVYGMYDSQALCFACLDEVGVWGPKISNPPKIETKKEKIMFPEEDREWSVSKQARNILEAIEFLSEADPKDLSSADWLLLHSKTKAQLAKLVEALDEDMQSIIRSAPVNFPAVSSKG